LVDLALSCILVPASTVLAVVCAGGPYGRHVQASEVVFLSVYACYIFDIVSDSNLLLNTICSVYTSKRSVLY